MGSPPGKADGVRKLTVKEKLLSRIAPERAHT